MGIISSPTRSWLYVRFHTTASIRLSAIRVRHQSHRRQHRPFHRAPKFGGPDLFELVSGTTSRTVYPVVVVTHYCRLAHEKKSPHTPLAFPPFAPRSILEVAVRPQKHRREGKKKKTAAAGMVLASWGRGHHPGKPRRLGRQSYG